MAAPRLDLVRRGRVARLFPGRLLAARRRRGAERVPQDYLFTGGLIMLEEEGNLQHAC